jgi:pimeloyl-ACP methyl ester carboxylesterase
VRDVLALMDALGLARVRLIGHHWGRVLGFRISPAAPERVRGFLALNTAHPWPLQRRLLPHVWRYWYTALLEYPGIGRWVLRHWPAFTVFLLRRGGLAQRPGRTARSAHTRPPCAIRPGPALASSSSSSGSTS